MSYRCVYVASLILTLICLTFSTTIPAEEPPLTERERKLLNLVEKLDQRVTDLEKRLETYEKAPAKPDAKLKERVTKIEIEAKEAHETKGKDFRVYWRDGLRLDSNNNDFKLRIGGRIHNDWGFFSLGDEISFAGRNAQDGTEFRRARIFIGGDIYENFEFKAQFDFASSRAEFKDVYVAVKNVPVLGKISVGHFKEPFGLEAMASSKNFTFMERGLSDVFTPGRNSGISVSNAVFNKRMGYAIGLFKETDNFGSGQDNNGGYNITGRITGAPWYAKDGRRVFHLGAAASYKDVDGTFRYRQRPGAHLIDALVDTNPVMTNSILAYNLGSALVVGPFSLQAEYTKADIDGMSGTPDADLSGYYAQVSYFLTGENRSYKLGDGTFGKVDINNKFKGFGQGGTGAWEVAARYSKLDLNDGMIRGGDIENYTLGLNWYLNANIKIMLNYVYGKVDRDLDIFDLENIIPAYDDNFNGIMTRFQVIW